MQSDLLVVIPAPLHAPGLPRAVLRSLAGQTLLRRALETAAGAVATRDQIVVLVDDDEVALFAERYGCRVQLVPGIGDASERALAASVDAAARQAEAARAAAFRAVMVFRPTAPLIRSLDLTRAVDRLFENGATSVLSEAPASSGTAPTVTFAVSRRQVMTSDRFLGDCVDVADIPAERALRIHSAHEWWVCERLLQRKRLVMVVIGYPAVGLGHVSRASILAHELMHHDISFLCPHGSDLAARQLAAHGLPVHRQVTEQLADSVLALQPDLVINDILNTDREYVDRLKAGGAAVVNFEDLGSGAQVADLVVNAVFMETAAPANHRNGPAYFCIRDEFLHAPERAARGDVREVLVTFGGTDSGDCTSRVAALLLPLARARGLHLSFVTGAGYAHLDRLRRLLAGVPETQATLAHATKRISEYMRRADLALSSAGRTVFELAAMRVPSIIIAANEREETHTFACEDNGFVYLGREDVVRDAEIVAALEGLIDSAATREVLASRMRKWDFRHGRERVLAAIESLMTRTPAWMA